MIDKTIEVERMEHVISVFGSFDQNLRIIESELSVKVLNRDDMIHICGEAEMWGERWLCYQKRLAP
jgi:phosphate starvation-inducible PhoH-like protein